MGAVTAREVLTLLERRGAHLVAGVSGLRHSVSWVVTMRPRPPAFERLEGGELALLSLSTLRTLHAQDDSLTLARLIEDLANRHVAMIAVAGLLAPETPSPAHFVSAPARVATAGEGELAATLGVPLVALPPGTALAEIEREVLAVVRRASAEPEAVDDLSRNVYNSLVRASLRGDDDRPLGARLAELLGVAVVLETDEGVEWCAPPEDFPLGREALAALVMRPSARKEAAESAPPAPLTLGRDLARLLIRLDVATAHTVGGDLEPPSDSSAGTHAQLGGTALGASTTLSLVFQRGAGERAARLASTLELVGPLFALALARRRDRAGVERRLRIEALDALLAGTYGDASHMTSRAAQLGHDLAQPHAVLVVEIGDGPSAQRAAETALVDEVPGAWSRVRAGELAALLPLREGADAAALASNLGSRLTRSLGERSWSAGLGRAVTGPAGVRHAYAEARDAARLGRLVLGPAQVARPADLGVYRLLLQLRGGGELKEFVQSTLGPLLADGRSGDALVETLEVFFACNGNLSEAARRLHLHRNSLIYRLNRARELLGHDLEDAELRLALQLALKARRVLDL